MGISVALVGYLNHVEHFKEVGWRFAVVDRWAHKYSVAENVLGVGMGALMLPEGKIG